MPLWGRTKVQTLPWRIFGSIRKRDPDSRSGRARRGASRRRRIPAREAAGQGPTDHFARTQRLVLRTIRWGSVNPISRQNLADTGRILKAAATVRQSPLSGLNREYADVPQRTTCHRRQSGSAALGMSRNTHRDVVNPSTQGCRAFAYRPPRVMTLDQYELRLTTKRRWVDWSVHPPLTNTLARARVLDRSPPETPG